MGVNRSRDRQTRTLGCQQLLDRVLSPGHYIGSAILGFFFPQKPWRWAVSLMLMQLVVMIATGSDLSLLPLGLVMLAVLSVPPALAGVLAGKLRE
jgi:hypothetical protein